MDFIKEYLIDNYVYIQLLPVIMGFIVWRRLGINYKWFVLLLLYSVLNELFKIYYGTYIVKDQNKILTNIYNVIYFGFLFQLFFNNSESQKIKRFLLIVVALYVVSIGYELVILEMNYHLESQIIPYIIGGFGVLIYTFYYLLNLLDSQKSINVFRSMLFWIIIAHFFYYLGFAPFKIGENYFASLEQYYYLFDLIKVPITFLKCIILSFGFLWSRPDLQ
jgi:hypothetical protein